MSIMKLVDRYGSKSAKLAVTSTISPSFHHRSNSKRETKAEIQAKLDRVAELYIEAQKEIWNNLTQQAKDRYDNNFKTYLKTDTEAVETLQILGAE